MKLTKNWKLELKSTFNIETISYIEYYIDCKTILITNCSKAKRKLPYPQIPKFLYISNRNSKFCKFCENNNFIYGIISDKYGVVFMDEKIGYYDKSPSDLTKKDKMNLGKKIERKINRKNFTKLIFYNPSPIMSIPYFEILYYSKLKVYYTTHLKLKSIKNLNLFERI